MNHRLAHSWAGLTVLFLGFNLNPTHASAPELRLPPRSPTAATGSQFVDRIALLSPEEREIQIEKEILAGNIPQFLRRPVPVMKSVTANGLSNTVRFFVTADYLAVGSDTDYLLIPMRPGTAQRIADASGCLLPTKVMVDTIYEGAPLKLVPAPIPPSPEMTSVAVFAKHNQTIRVQRAVHLRSYPLGALVAGHKKDVVLSNRLTNRTGNVAIYGWHRWETNLQANGSGEPRDSFKPIQPLYAGHKSEWVDYSHGVRLVHEIAELNGKSVLLADLLTNSATSSLLSDEGPLAATRYPQDARTERSSRFLSTLETEEIGWTTNRSFRERTLTQ